MVDTTCFLLQLCRTRKQNNFLYGIYTIAICIFCQTPKHFHAFQEQVFQAHLITTATTQAAANEMLHIEKSPLWCAYASTGAKTPHKN